MNQPTLWAGHAHSRPECVSALTSANCQRSQTHAHTHRHTRSLSRLATCARKSMLHFFHFCIKPAKPNINKPEKRRGKPTTNRLNRINSLPNTHTIHTHTHTQNTHSNPYRSQGLCMCVVNDSLLIAHFAHTHTYIHTSCQQAHTHKHTPSIHPTVLHMIFKCFRFFYSPAFHLIFAKQISPNKK